VPDYPNNNELTQAVSIIRKYVLTRWQHCLPRENGNPPFEELNPGNVHHEGKCEKASVEPKL